MILAPESIAAAPEGGGFADLIGKELGEPSPPSAPLTFAERQPAGILPPQLIEPTAAEVELFRTWSQGAAVGGPVDLEALGTAANRVGAPILQDTVFFRGVEEGMPIVGDLAPPPPFGEVGKRSFLSVSDDSTGETFALADNARLAEDGLPIPVARIIASPGTRGLNIAPSAYIQLRVR